MQVLLSNRYWTSIGLLVISVSLWGCKTPTQTSVAPAERQIVQTDKLPRDQQFVAAARAYEEQAARQSGEQRNRLLLRAAHEWLRADDSAHAQAILQRIGDQSASSDMPLRQLVSAQVALANKQPAQALAELDRIPQPYPKEQAADILELRTRALFAYDRPVGAVMAALDREQLLNDPREIERSRRMLWDGVIRSAADGANLQPPQGASRAVAGWLELGRPALALARNPFSAQAALTEWRNKYPEHPANELLNRQVLPQLAATIVYPEQIAVLLPLSGPQQAIGTVIRDGLIAASMQQPSDARPRIKIYDSAQSAAAAYDQAIVDGANFIIGPLLREEVMQVASRSKIDVPTLALNSIVDKRDDNAPLFQFALDPAEEAQQIAVRAVGDGKRHGVALLPNTDWGKRVQVAFDARLRELGGTLVTTRLYDPATKDYSDPVRTTLLMNESRARAAALNAALGTKFEFEPRPRGDIDFIFVGGQPAQGRLLRPALRFNLSDEMPVYAMSDIFEPDAAANADLDGILFPDMPWVVAPDDVATQLRNTLSKYWPTRMRGRSRYFAFGFDSYRLIPLLLARSLQAANAATPGMTGMLSIDANGRVHRQLQWARIANGQPQPINNSVIDTQVKNQ